MRGPKVLAVILAGGAGGRLGLLTEERAKPSVRFGGSYRLIDFPLSNCVNAEISNVWVIQQHNPASLNDHLANGRPWDLDRTIGGLLTLPPHLGSDREGWGKGTADSLWRKAELIREFSPDVLVVVSADAAYRCDYAELAAGHLESGAGVTMLTTKVSEDASRFGVVEVEGDRIVGYEYKPGSPASDLVTTEVFAFDPDRTLALLNDIAETKQWRKGDRDLGHQLLPRLVEAGAARDVRLDGYWRDVGTIDAYWEAHMELASDDPPFRLDDKDWPIRTADDARGPVHVDQLGRVSSALLGRGARVAGHVERSVLGPGVVVQPGATVRDAVLLDDVVVHGGAVIDHAIVDEGAIVEKDTRIVGSAANDGKAAITVIRAGERVPSDAAIPAGTQWPRPPED